MKLRRNKICSIFLIPFIFLFITNINAQTKDSTKVKKPKSIKLVPYINYGRNYGGMFGVLPLAMYRLKKTDTISPYSITGGLGIYSTNKSYVISAFSVWYIDEDKWRIKFALGTGNINSQFYMTSDINDFVDYSAANEFLFLEINRRIVKNIYGGLSYTYTKFDNTFHIPSTPLEETVKLNGLGIDLAWDNRDNNYYPKKGLFMNARFTTYPEFLGNEENTQQLKIKFNKYFSARNMKDVIATRVFIGLGFGEVPFNKELTMSGVDLRGYTQGEYRGKQKIALQGEYRYNFGHKLGAVGFFWSGKCI